MEKVKIYFSKLRPDAVIPSKREEDAGYDLYACLETDWLEYAPHQTQPLPTGIASAFSDDYYFHIGERGSSGAKSISKRAGVIDSGYRGEWFVMLTNLNDVPLYFVKPEAEARLRGSCGPGCLHTRCRRSPALPCPQAPPFSGSAGACWRGPDAMIPNKQQRRVCYELFCAEGRASPPGAGMPYPRLRRDGAYRAGDCV